MNTKRNNGDEQQSYIPPGHESKSGQYTNKTYCDDFIEKEGCTKEELKRLLTREEYDAKYTIKQQDMWEMTLQLLKDNYPKEIYYEDDKFDMNYLRNYHVLRMQDEDFTYFTLSEWFSYMKSQE